MSVFKQTIAAITAIANTMTTRVAGLFQVQHLDQANISKHLQSVVPTLFDDTFDQLHNAVIYHSSTLTPALVQALPIFADELKKEAIAMNPQAIASTKLAESDKNSHGIDFVTNLGKADSFGLDYDMLRLSIVYGLRDVSVWLRMSRNDSMISETEVARVMFNYTRPATYGFQDQLRNKPMRDLARTMGDTNAWLVRSSFEVLASEHGPWAVSTVRSIDRQNHICTLQDPFEHVVKNRPIMPASSTPKPMMGNFVHWGAPYFHPTQPLSPFEEAERALRASNKAASEFGRPEFEPYTPIRFIEFNGQRLMFDEKECLCIIQTASNITLNKTTLERQVFHHSGGRFLTINNHQEWLAFFRVFTDDFAVNIVNMKYTRQALRAFTQHAKAVTRIRHENLAILQALHRDEHVMILQVWYRGREYLIDPPHLSWYLTIMAGRSIYDCLPSKMSPCPGIELHAAEAIGEFYTQVLVALKRSSIGDRFPSLVAVDASEAATIAHEPVNGKAFDFGEEVPANPKEAEATSKKVDEGAVGSEPQAASMSIASLPDETDLEKRLRVYREKNGSFPMEIIDQAMAYLAAKPDGFVLPVLSHTKNQYRLFTKHALFMVFGQAVVTNRKRPDYLDVELRFRLNVCELSDVNYVVGERTAVIATVRQLTNFFQSITAALRSQPDWVEAKPADASGSTEQTEAPTTQPADIAAG